MIPGQSESDSCQLDPEPRASISAAPVSDVAKPSNSTRYVLYIYLYAE